ncbi:PREDICTED: RING-H2 finger protein ATL2 [Brassica oleracea var. oleracea]|uniref:RING-type domain-containing protein n=1 Tax=Brassica oleracea var. oleracea TaxID=109376 RepID=A0A0D3DVF8_BRAOL|nr:PREDICTED: RING-H2 finger protein ATL2 [Brassica oleracea var. oleracea]
MDIIALTSFDQTFYHQRSRKNRVCISFYQRFQRFAVDDTDGTLVCTGLDPPFHFPSRQINLNLISHQLSPRYLFRLVDSRLHDRTLSRRIAEKIAAEAVQYVGFLQPYVMSVYVVKTQQVVTLREEEEEEETQKEEEESTTCAICLEGLYKNDETFDLPYCSHRFHSTCVGEWLQSHNSCPLCREVLLEEYVETDFY